MQLTHGLSKVLPKANPKRHSPEPARTAGSKEAIAEIYAYIAIRDDLLSEAEQLRTRAKIDSLCAANNFVATCLKAARPPYQAQCLPEADAIHQRKRCQAIKVRISELSSQIAGRPA
jgi:hypothetical protein